MWVRVGGEAADGSRWVAYLSCTRSFCWAGQDSDAEPASGAGALELSEVRGCHLETPYTCVRAYADAHNHAHPGWSAAQEGY